VSTTNGNMIAEHVVLNDFVFTTSEEQDAYNVFLSFFVSTEKPNTFV
jgi:hypothetical protein